LKVRILFLIYGRPSVDRIDRSKNYSLYNIQFIELKDNVKKDRNNLSIEGQKACKICGESKHVSNFSLDKRTYSGRSSTCNHCNGIDK
jgi:hypothetical protein